MTITPAHYQTIVVRERLRLWYPDHQPREQDPHYRLFHQAKARMRKADVPCWRCGVRYADLNPRLGMPATPANPLGAHQLEAHHQDIEYALSNAVDVDQWWQASSEEVCGAFTRVYSDVAGFLAEHPELDPANRQDVFDAYVESEGQLQQLCDICHRSPDQGVHHLNYPDWRPLAIWRRELPPHVQAAP